MLVFVNSSHATNLIKQSKIKFNYPYSETWYGAYVPDCCDDGVCKSVVAEDPDNCGVVQGVPVPWAKFVCGSNYASTMSEINRENLAEACRNNVDNRMAQLSINVDGAAPKPQTMNDYSWKAKYEYLVSLIESSFGKKYDRTKLGSSVITTDIVNCIDRHRLKANKLNEFVDWLCDKLGVPVRDTDNSIVDIKSALEGLFEEDRDMEKELDGYMNIMSRIRNEYHCPEKENIIPFIEELCVENEKQEALIDSLEKTNNNLIAETQDLKAKLAHLTVQLAAKSANDRIEEEKAKLEAKQKTHVWFKGAWYKK